MFEDIAQELRDIGRDALADRLLSAVAAEEASHAKEVLDLAVQVKALQDQLAAKP